MADLRLLVNSRKYIRKLVTESFNVRSRISTLSELDRLSLTAKLKEHREKLDKLNEKILSGRTEQDSDGAMEDEFEVIEDYNSKLRECFVLIEACIPNVSSSRGMDTARSLLKSPVAPLPRFTSAEGEDLTRFFQEFEETISKYSYPDYDKLLLLKQQISGRALLLVNSLEADKQGYSHAKTLLTSALASTETQIFNVIKQLVDIRMFPQDDPFEFISKMRVISESIKKLNVQTESFLQYFFWRGLNEDFQMQLIAITNHTRPSLQEINDYIFEASDRYLQAKKLKTVKDSVKMSEGKGSQKGASAGYAVNVNYPSRDKFSSFKPCSICTHDESKDASHPIFKCQKYDSAKAKVEHLKRINACLKCANTNHLTEACRYRFNSRCKHCSDWHFGFLCLKRKEPSSTEGKGEVKVFIPKGDSKWDREKHKTNTSNHTATITEALPTYLGEESILPTFSCELEDRLKIRALKDGGCQSNFISEGVAASLNLKVLKDNVQLIVNGINVSQEYHTKLVEVHVRMGPAEHLLQALCLPSINVCLKLPHLGSVVQGFINKGYCLADDYLRSSHDRITNIDFILGTSGAYCMPSTDTVFGLDGRSLYSLTPIGVMLRGSTDQLLRDLVHLPPCNTMPSDRKCDDLTELRVTDPPFHGEVGILSSSTSLKDETEAPIITVLQENGSINYSELTKATNQMLESSCQYYTNYDTFAGDDASYEVNDKLVKYVLDTTTRDSDGRLVMPLLWNSEVSHLLGRNRTLSKLILKSVCSKMRKNPTHLDLMNKAIKEQEHSGIIERIDDPEQFLNDHPEHSFLPHMGVFKLARETTKCRVVFLSNICENDPTKPMTVSHNQAIHSGPSLNQKLCSALLHLRFDSKLLCFDLEKAFNNISLSEVDQNRLLFFWFRNAEKGDFTPVVYKNVRLSFGLRCSPTLLLLALYKILVLDSVRDSDELRQVKLLIYQLSYMDNCAITCNDSDSLRVAYGQLEGVFHPYKFVLQQFITNDENLQSEIDLEREEQTPSVVKLLGLQWNRETDELGTRPINLDMNGHTKRGILSSIASQFDIYNFNGPVLNRSRLFLHTLQCNKDLGWDQKLSPDLLRQWRNIAKQANSTPEIKIKRFLGRREDSYRLFAFADSSKTMFGCVLFIQCVETGAVNFVLAKNRIVNQKLEAKSIPSLELQGVTLATECVVDVYRELSDACCIKPIKIVELKVFSDSLVCLSWLNNYTNKLTKMQKQSVFVMNRLNSIAKLCTVAPVTFSFVSGDENPGDCITRSLSYKQLMKSTYWSGPSFLVCSKAEGLSREDILTFTVPNPLTNQTYSVEEGGETHCSQVVLGGLVESEQYSTLLNNTSSFRRLIAVYQRVLEFVDKLKRKLKIRSPERFGHVIVRGEGYNFFDDANQVVFMQDQRANFPEVFRYFDSSNKKNKDIPNIVKQLNVYVDRCGLLHVRCKLDRVVEGKLTAFPMLLAKDSRLSDLIIREYHERFSHAGTYALLAELRRKVWIPHIFSLVKKILRQCVTCRRFKERTIKLNQSPYREFRLKSPCVPYSQVFMDYIGPFNVKFGGKREKVWLLCVTCMWSRAINLKVCYDPSVREFLRAFQIHCFEYGVAQYCITDLGSQLVAGANVVADYIKDPETQLYFKEHGVEPLKFEQYYKGRSELGSMVESCVKLTKRLIFGAIKNNVLPVRDFEFVICQTIHLVNRRPVAFKEALRDSKDLDAPSPITPENLIRGYDLISLNIVPELHRQPEHDPSWQPTAEPVDSIRKGYQQLQKVRCTLIDQYHEEFLANLISQSVDRKDRYKPVYHKLLRVGDVVLLKEPFCKPSSYPMGVVRELTINVNNEVTGAVILKGKNRELVKRHSSTLIPLLTGSEVSDSLGESAVELSAAPRDQPIVVAGTSRPRRDAAAAALLRIRETLSD